MKISVCLMPFQAMKEGANAMVDDRDKADGEGNDGMVL